MPKGTGSPKRGSASPKIMHAGHMQDTQRQDCGWHQTHITHGQLEVGRGDVGHWVLLHHVLHALSHTLLLTQLSALDVLFNALTDGKLDGTLANLRQVRTSELVRELGKVVLPTSTGTKHPRDQAGERTRSTSGCTGDLRRTAFRMDKRDGLSGMGMKMSWSRRPGRMMAGSRMSGLPRDQWCERGKDGGKGEDRSLRGREAERESARPRGRR